MKGEGSIYRLKDGRWAYDYDLPRGPFGKRRRRRVTAKTQHAVREAKLAILRDLQHGIEPAATVVLADWLEQTWLPMVLNRRRGSTAGDYQRSLKRIVAWAGRRHLAQITPASLERWYRELAEQGVGPRAIAKVHACLRAALTYAVRTEVARRNVAALVEPPAYEPKSRQTYSVAEAARFLAAAKGMPGEALFLAALFVQMRSGELLALRWTDVDMKAGVVHVQRTLTEDAHGRPVVGETTKTRAGVRTIALPQIVLAALREHRKALFADADRPPSNLVFPNDRGKPLSRHNLSRRWLRAIQDAAGLPPITLHELRHTGASILRTLGGDLIALRDRLGHESIETTADLYVHLDLAAQKRLSKTLDRTFFTRDG